MGLGVSHFFGEAPERRPWARKRERSPGGFCPALRRGVHSKLSVTRVRSMWAAIHTGRLRLRFSGFSHAVGRGGLALRGGLTGGFADGFGCGWHGLTGKYHC